MAPISRITKKSWESRSDAIESRTEYESNSTEFSTQFDRITLLKKFYRQISRIKNFKVKISVDFFDDIESKSPYSLCKGEEVAGIPFVLAYVHV